MGLLLPVLLTSLTHGEIVELRTFTYRTKVRVSTFAREAKSITNPLNWPHVRHVVPDGSFVEQGSVIVEFDRDDLEFRLADAQREGVAVQAELQRKLTELQNNETALRDALTGLEDQQVVMQTQMDRQRALPDPDDVTIARGRLKVARLAADAAAKDLETARDRFERKMISQAELDVYDRADRKAQARLRYRQDSLDLISEGARPSTIRKTELRIANLKLEISRTTRQLEKNTQVSAIERRAAKARASLIGNRIAELERDLGNTEIKAPISGHVVYMPIFRQRMVASGDRMWKGFSFLQMPNPETLAFRGAVREGERRYFARGDRALVRVSSRPGEPLEGEIVSFSELPRDRGETEDQQWLQQADSGVMVYDMVVRVEDVPDWVQVGVTGECELTASREEEHPAVSAALAKLERGSFHLAFDGVYEPVDGRIVDGFLVLTDRALVGREAGLFGRFPDQVEREERRARTGRFTVSAELEPADTADVVVGKIHGREIIPGISGTKIAWLVPEDTVVEEGAVVAQLDKSDTDEEIKRRESALQRAVSGREREEQSAKLRARQYQFSLERAQNLLKIASLDQQELLENRMTIGRQSARLNSELADIRLTFLRRELARVEGSDLRSRSRVEIAKLRRDCRRAELQREAARIRLDKLERGPEELARAGAERNRANQELTVVTQTRESETDEARFGYLLRMTQREERRARDRLEEMKERLANLTLKAPRAGLAQYEKAWQGGVWAKVRVGSQVGQRAVVMKIADVSRMYMRAELPEKCFGQVKEGVEVDVAIPALNDAVLKGKVSEVEFLFRRKRRKDSEVGLYSGHEALGETVFFVRVEVEAQQGVELKPGAMAEIIFPFEP